MSFFFINFSHFFSIQFLVIFFYNNIYIFFFLVLFFFLINFINFDFLNNNCKKKTVMENIYQQQSNMKWLIQKMRHAIDCVCVCVVFYVILCTYTMNLWKLFSGLIGFDRCAWWAVVLWMGLIFMYLFYFSSVCLFWMNL